MLLRIRQGFEIEVHRFSLYVRVGRFERYYNNITSKLVVCSPPVLSLQATLLLRSPSRLPLPHQLYALRRVESLFAQWSIQ
jgi:hypothetical protein